MDDQKLTFALMDILGFIIGVTFHEFGHAFAADRLGDDTPRSQGRVELNPIDHLDPLGSIVFLLSALFGTPFGWGKPVMIRPAAFKHPRRDQIIVAAAGPLMNLILAAIFAIAVRVTYQQLTDASVYWQLLCQCLYVNLLMLMFNMIPLPPLDGSKIFSNILPAPQAIAYDKMMAQWGMYLFMILFFTAGYFIGPTVNNLANWMGNTIDASVVFAV